MLRLLERHLAGASRRFARNTPFRPFRLADERPVVAFTFDDFPASAAYHAAPILETAGFRGTFYFASGLAGQNENGQPIATIAEAAALADRGHEIGAHTHGHIDVQQARPDLLAADIATNAFLITTAVGAPPPSSFAYPFGIAGIRSKRALSRQFAGLRGIRGGINRGIIDLAQLRAEELYDSTSTLATIEHRLDDLEQNGGWLIFYTHDVRPDPTAIGCSPSHFARVVESVQRRRIAVETVAVTLERIGASGRKARS